MFQQRNRPYLQRDVKTSEPRFKRLQIKSPEERSTTMSNFRQNPNKTYALDNSKENVCYESHLSKVRSAIKIDETSIVSKYLGTIRKDYDDMNKMSRKQLSSMRLKRREIDFMRKKNVVFCEKREELEACIAEKEKKTNIVKAKEEATKMQTKTLQNIIVRMKKDQIFFKQFGRIRDEQIKKKMKDVKILQQKLIQQEQKLHKLTLSLQNCKQIYNKNKEARQNKFEDFSGKISDVRERQRFMQQRKERTFELQSIELNDTLDDKNIHMRQIILAHKVADNLLESKVNTLIKRYSQTQAAFHIVKIKTGVSQPHFLTNKFFSYEQTSESLLASINQNQAYLESLKAKKQKLTDHYRSAINTQLLNEDGLEDIMCQQKKLQKEKLINETNRNELLLNSVKNWINKMTKQFKPQTSKNVKLDDRFSKVCQTIKQEIKKNQNINWAEHKMPTVGVCLKKMVRQKTAQELSLRLRESQQMNDSNLIEQEYIKSSRQVIQKKSFTIKQIKKDTKIYE